MLRGETYYYNDSEILHYEVTLRSSSSSSSTSSSSASFSSSSKSSSSMSAPFRYQAPDEGCELDDGDNGDSGSGSGSDDAPGPLISLDKRGIIPLKKIASGKIASSKI